MTTPAVQYLESPDWPEALSASEYRRAIKRAADAERKTFVFPMWQRVRVTRDENPDIYIAEEMS